MGSDETKTVEHWACAPCRGACCRVGWRPFSANDVARILASPLASKAEKTMEEHGLSKSGFKMAGVCCFLEEDGCCLGEFRPDICKSWFCPAVERHEEGLISEAELLATVTDSGWPAKLLKAVNERNASEAKTEASTVFDLGPLRLEEFLAFRDETVLSETAPPDPDIEEWIVKSKKLLPKKDHWKLFARAWGWYKRGQKPFEFKSGASTSRYLKKHFKTG